MLMHALILTLYGIYENCNQLISKVALVTLPYREASVYKAFFPPKRYVYPWDGTQNQLCMKLPSVLTLVRSRFV